MSSSNGFSPNSLYALEKSLFGHTLALRSAETFATEEEEDEAPQPADHTMAESRSFDWDEAIELSDDPEEANAFDWDEAIELSDDPEEVEAFSGQDFGEHLDADEDQSGSLSWDDFSQGLEEDASDDGQASNHRNDYVDPLSHSNSLFALEQSVLGIGIPSPTAMQLAAGDDPESEPEPELAESRAFDWDEAIELSYDESAYPADEDMASSSSQSFDWEEPIELSYNESAATAEEMADSFDWLPREEPYGFGLEHEPPTYEVEAFEVEDSSEPDPQDSVSSSQAYGFEIDQEADAVYRSARDQEPDFSQAHDSDDVWINSQAYNLESDQNQATIAPPTPLPTSPPQIPAPQTPLPQTPPPQTQSSAAIPVQATIANPPVAPSKSAAPPAKALDFDFDEFDRAPISGQTDQASDAEAFAADLEAILRGEKVYEPPAESAPPPPAPQPSPPAPSAPPASAPSQAQSLPKKQPSGHDIFDQMAHATAFDLGTFSLEQTFNEFDAMLDAEENIPLADEASAPANAGVPPVFHNTGSAAIAQSPRWDTHEIAADVAALSADDWQALQFDLDDDDSGDYSEAKDSATPYPQAMASPRKQAATLPNITGAELKQRYWHQISRGGTANNPNEVSGYYWSGATNQEPTQFKKIGTPTTPDQFGVYRQYVQHSSGVVKKNPSTFFPDAWEEKHFDALFELAAQQPGFKPESDTKLTILGALAGDEQYKGMQVFFMHSKKGGDHCIPNYLLKKDPGVKGQLKTQKPGRTPAATPTPPATTPEQPPMSQEASISEMMGDDFDSLEEMYGGLELDGGNALYEELSADDLAERGAVGGLEEAEDGNRQDSITSQMGEVKGMEFTNQMGKGHSTLRMGKGSGGGKGGDKGKEPPKTPSSTKPTPPLDTSNPHDLFLRIWANPAAKQLLHQYAHSDLQRVADLDLLMAIEARNYNAARNIISNPSNSPFTVNLVVFDSMNPQGITDDYLDQSVDSIIGEFTQAHFNFGKFYSSPQAQEIARILAQS